MLGMPQQCVRIVCSSVMLWVRVNLRNLKMLSIAQQCKKQAIQPQIKKIEYTPTYVIRQGFQFGRSTHWIEIKLGFRQKPSTWVCHRFEILFDNIVSKRVELVASIFLLPSCMHCRHYNWHSNREQPWDTWAHQLALSLMPPK